MLKSKCHEIRLDLQTTSNKHAIEAKTLHEKSIADLQSLFERLRDASDILQTDAKMRLHFYKADNREELQKLDSVLHQENGHLTVTMSDIRTNTETVKLRAIYTFTSNTCPISRTCATWLSNVWSINLFRFLFALTSCSIFYLHDDGDRKKLVKRPRNEKTQSQFDCLRRR